MSTTKTAYKGRVHCVKLLFDLIIIAILTLKRREIPQVVYAPPGNVAVYQGAAAIKNTLYNATEPATNGDP